MSVVVNIALFPLCAEIRMVFLVWFAGQDGHCLIIVRLHLLTHKHSGTSGQTDSDCDLIQFNVICNQVDRVIQYKTPALNCDTEMRVSRR